MSMSLRDQLLQAGLISQKQARDADREQQRRSQPPPRHKRGPGTAPSAARSPGSGGHPAQGGAPGQGGAPAQGGPPSQSAQRPHPPAGAANTANAAQAGKTSHNPNIALAAKAARDQALNRKQHEKAQRKALQAQIKQLIEQNRIPSIDSEDWYNFVDGDKVRRIAVNAAVRAQLMNGQLVIVGHQARYDLVPAAAAARIRERDAAAVLSVASTAASTAGDTPPADDPYARFTVPDDLMW